jgi:multiple sugar transport system ATP-binding protein
MANVSLRNVSKVYEDGTVAVSDLSLEVEDKEFLILVGPSGCGKTTTLRMIAGLEEVSSGEIYIDGRLVNDAKPKDRDIAMVFQNYALYPHMSVYDNMAFGLKCRKVPKDEIDRRVHEAAQVLGLEPYLKRKPKALSGGQKQRVAMGRAIVRSPKAFLMDEPLSNLDAKLRGQMRVELSRLHRRLGATIVYVTHDQVEAMTLGTRIVVMNEGVVQQVDTPKNLYQRPANMFVAGFIGAPQINFLPARCERVGEGLGLVVDGHGCPLPQPLAGRLEEGGYEGREVVVGVRPEAVGLRECEGRCLRLPAKLRMNELLGSESLVYTEACGHDVVAKLEGDIDLEDGQSLELSLPIDRMCLFDPETKAAIR